MPLDEAIPGKLKRDEESDFAAMKTESCTLMVIDGADGLDYVSWMMISWDIFVKMSFYAKAGLRTDEKSEINPVLEWMELSNACMLV